MTSAKRILERRAHFVAVALASCTPAQHPALADPVPPSIDAGAPPPAEDSGIEDAGVDARQPIAMACLSIRIVSAVIFTKGTSIAETSVVEEIARILQQRPDIHVELHGHTIPGEPAKLGQDRADVVKAELVRRGIAADRLTTANDGSKKPVRLPDDDPQNRRVDYQLKERP